MRRKIAFALLGGFLLFLLLLAGGVFRYGGFGPLMASINGEVVYIAPPTLKLGAFEAGAETVAVFKMTNLTSREVSVVGERSSCSCAFSETIPISALPGKTVDLKIRVQLPRYESTYDQTLTFMIAGPERLAMHPVRILASVPKPLPVPVESQETALSEENPAHDENAGDSGE